MKKILSVLLLAAVCFSSSAQSTTPRWGTGANQDNTGRTLTYKYVVATDATGADTVRLNLSAYQTVVKATVIDSVTFSFPSVTKCYAGDKATFIVTNTSGAGHLVKFTGANAQIGSGGALALTSAKLATISFIFNGSVWLEASRTVQ